jgi:hypothetical protein
VPSVINHYERYRAAVMPAGTVPAPIRRDAALLIR